MHQGYELHVLQQNVTPLLSVLLSYCFVAECDSITLCLIVLLLCSRMWLHYTLSYCQLIMSQWKQCDMLQEQNKINWSVTFFPAFLYNRLLRKFIEIQYFYIYVLSNNNVITIININHPFLKRKFWWLCKNI